MSTYDNNLIPQCPSCGAKMAVRTRRADDTRFFGCGRFPDCRKTLSLAKGEELARKQEAEKPKQLELQEWVDEGLDMSNLHKIMDADWLSKNTNPVAMKSEIAKSDNPIKFALPPRPPKQKKIKFQPTEEQVLMKEYMLNSNKDDLLGEAYAGSGKSSTFGKMIMPALPKGSKIGYFAFGRKNATDFWNSYRMPSSTFHAFGKSQLERVYGEMEELDGSLKKKIAGDLIPEGTVIGKNDDGSKRYATRVEWSLLSKLCSMVQNTWTHPHYETGIREMISNYDMDMDGLEDLFIPLVPKVLNLCVHHWVNFRIMDHDAMQWLPMWLQKVENKNIIVPTYDYAGIDECQDLTMLQILMSLELVKDDGRLAFIGDRFQAIYGWRGSLVDSIDHITELAYNIEKLPLSTCFRSAQSHIEHLARPLVPWIRPYENNPKGTIRHNVSLERCVQEWMMLDTCLILCRINAPLVKSAYKLLKEDKKVTILGKNFAKGLISLIKKMKADNIAHLVKKLNEYRMREIEKLSEKDDEKAIESLSDRVDCIVEMTDGTDTISQLINKIDVLFNDDPSPGAVFGTYYRAKGMESDDVYLLEPGLCPFPKVPRYTEYPGNNGQSSYKLSDAIKQERNGMYITATRSTMNFTSVEGELNIEIGSTITKEELYEQGEDYDSILANTRNN